MLAFQKLDVYQCAVRLLALCSLLCKSVPRGYSGLVDQLRRSSLSVPLNIAEGSGRTTRADAARHYGIARGSARESAAILDALRAVGGAESALLEEAGELAVRVVEMLSKMAL